VRLPPGVTIRAGTTGDAPFICRVHEESIRGLGPRAYSRAEVESWVAGLQPDRYAWGMTHGGYIYFVAEVPGTGVIGFCCYVAGEVMALYILPEWTRRGIGSALLGRAERGIGAAGHERIRLVAALNSVGFYSARGYREIRRRDWKTRGGLIVTAVDMEKPACPTPAARDRGRR